MTQKVQKPDWDYRLDVLAAAFGRFTCNYKCVYCHKDYFCQTIPADAPAWELAEGVQLCSTILKGTYSVHLAGSGEPLLVPNAKLQAMVAALRRSQDCVAISMTSNGYYLEERAKDLDELGIHDINVSLPCLDSTYCQKFMQVSAKRAQHIIAKTKRGLAAARRHNVSVDVNVCVAYDVSASLDDYIALSRDYDVQIKFFSVISATKSHAAAEYGYYQKLIDRLSAIQAPLQNTTGRYTTLEWAFDQARFKAKLHNRFCRPPECYRCHAFARCEESCWRSVRVSPWYIQPCGVRTDNLYWYQERDVAALLDKLTVGGKLSRVVEAECRFKELRN